VADAIAVVRHNIAAAVTSMAQGERDVRDVGGIADEADRALGTMLDGIRRIAEVIGETATVSRAQSTTMETLTATMTGVQTVALEASSRANAASGVATAQIGTLDELSTTSRQLAQLAERLRHSVSRFAVSDSPVDGSTDAVVSSGAFQEPNRVARRVGEVLATR
jgi:methyl-accepting chemotaxis protein